MTTTLVVSDDSDQVPATSRPRSKWIKLSALTLASVAAGGLAAFLVYRKTVEKLHTAALDTTNPDFRISDQHEDEDS